jgi:hypothetical protein
MLGKIKTGKFIFWECFRMELPYERLTEDLRRTERLKRQRAREAWKRGTALEKYLYNLGTVTASALEDQEDNVLRLVALEAEGKAVLLAAMRRTAKDLLEIYSQINAANLYNFNIVEQLFDGKTAVEGLSEDQQKLLKNIIKEEHSAGKAKKEKETENKPYDRPAAAEAAATSGAGVGWGYAPPFPYVQQAPQFAGGVFPGMVMQAWPQMPGAGGQGYGQSNFGGGQGGGQQGGGQFGGGQFSGGQFGGGQFSSGQMYGGNNSGGGAGYSGGGGAGYGGGARAQDNKRKYPCDNCGQMGHWKFQNVCPNYHMHLEQLAAKSATARAAQQQGGPAGGFQQPTGSTLALPPPPPPGSNFYIIVFGYVEDCHKEVFRLYKFGIWQIII